MSDFLLQLGQNPSARKAIKALGLPLPLPQALRRERGPWRPRPLEQMVMVVGAAEGASLLEPLAWALAEAGAEALVAGGEALFEPFAAPSEAYGRPARPIVLTEPPLEGVRPAALVFDASGLRKVGDLEQLHRFFHPLVRALGRCGRVVVLGRSPEAQADREAAAAQAALSGFVRTVAKEIGKKGSTANLLILGEGAEERLAGPLRFFLSARSAFVSAQPVVLSTRATAPAGPVPFERPLDGKVALVTGAARGIGAATAQRLAEEGARVVCLDRPADDVAVSRLARDLGGEVLLADVTDDDAPARIAEELGRLGGVDVVIHNAGITRDKTLGRMSAEAWQAVLGVNLAAVTKITDALIEGPLRDDGRIVCLSSVAGLAGNLGQSNYAASKAALVGLVERLSGELAGRGVTANAVAPGFIETQMTARIPPMIREAGRRLSALGQGGQPVDVAETITFLASPGASGLTGGTLRVCGGALMGA